MNPVAATMPEARFRTTKKRVQPVGSLLVSEFAHEIKAFQPRVEQAKTTSKKMRGKFSAVWPVAVGLFLAGFAPEWHAMAAQASVWALRFVFPLWLLAGPGQAAIDGQTASMLPQIAIYAQLPLDGLLVMLLARGKGFRSAIGQLFLAHCACTFVLWLLAFAN